MLLNLNIMNAVINFHAPLKKLNKKTKTVSTKTMNHKRNSKCYSNKKCYNDIKDMKNSGGESNQ